MESIEATSASRLRVVSAIPGRIRLHAGGARGLPELTRLPDALESVPELTAIQLRLAAYSAILHFDARDGEKVWDALRRLGIHPPTRRGGRAKRDLGRVINGAAEAANGIVAERLGGHDLRQLLPLGLGLMSLRQMLGGEERLAGAPWYVLAWYASELLFRFQGAPASRARERSKEEE